MSVGFLLLHAQPGCSGDVAARLADLPEVTRSQVLFGEQIAVRIEAPRDNLESAADRLGALDGVASATLYRSSGRVPLPTPA